MSIEEAIILERVAAEFGRRPDTLFKRPPLGKGDLARRVFIYMLVTRLPVPERFPSKTPGSTRPRGPNDGNTKRVARFMGVHSQAVRDILRRVENARDDVQFDERLTRLEHEIDTALDKL